MKKVYVIIVNYNTWVHTIECLESLLKINYFNFQILVVDNNSSNESWYELKNWAEREKEYIFDTPFELKDHVYPLSLKPTEFVMIDEIELNNDVLFDQRIVFIKSRHNLGFAAGNNIATRYVCNNNDVEYVWYLNNDTIVPRDCLKTMVEYYEKYRPYNLGILGAKLNYYYASNVIQAIGGTYNKFFAITGHLNEFEKDGDDIIIDKKKIDYIVGASMLVSKDFLSNVGLMSEDYFLYYEEVDWAIRAKRRNWTIDICTDCTVYHKEGISIGSNLGKNEKSRLSDYYGVSNRIAITRKYYPILLPFVYLSFIGILINRLRRKQFDRINMLLEIITNNILRKRN